jgi:Domain of unknown function (DUF4262)
MTNKRSTSRISGRFTSPGTSRPGSTLSKRSECPCVACLAEESGVPFDYVASWARMQRIIETKGYCIQYVMAPPNGVPWAYTIGRLRVGLPELVVVGLDSVGSAAIINSIVSEWEAIVIPEDGASHIPSNPSHKFGAVAIPDGLWDGDYLLGAQRDAREHGLVEHRLALQVLWLEDGMLPWDPDASPGLRRRQPILGLQPGASTRGLNSRGD